MFNVFNSFFPFMFSTSFLLFWLLFAFVAWKIIAQWRHNNNSPRLSVDAWVVDKHQSSHFDNTTHTHHSSYHITFEVESGDQMNFLVQHYEYAELVVGDFGRLHFQGTRFLGFDRMPENPQ